MLFDTHAHYDDARFDEDRDALLRAMPGKNVGLIVNPGCDLPSSRMAVDMAHKYDFLYAAVGIHPENCADFAPARTSPATLEFLASFMATLPPKECPTTITSSIL